ncbi:MAG: PAS domain-containing protein [Myxococcota bacterium]
MRSTVRWVGVGVAAGVATLAVVYGGLAPAAIVDRHRASAAWFVLDALPVWFGWVGWLTARLRQAERALIDAYVTGPFADGAPGAALVDAVVLVGANGVVLAANPAARALFERDDLVGAPFRALVPDLDRPDLRPSERLTAEGKLVGVDWHLAAALPGGRFVPVRLSCGPVGGHAVVYAIAPEPLARPADDPGRDRDPAAVTRIRSALLGSVVRELDRPVAALVAGGAAPADAVEALARLAADLQDLASVELGRMTFADEEVALGPLLARFAAPDLTVPASSGLVVRGDGLRVAQIVDRLTRVVGRPCRITVEPEASAEPFVRLELSGPPNAGDRVPALGIALGRALVHALGGTVAAVGGGFTVRLPAIDTHRTIVPADVRARRGPRGRRVPAGRSPDPFTG